MSKIKQELPQISEEVHKPANTKQAIGAFVTVLAATTAISMVAQREINPYEALIKTVYEVTITTS